MDCAHRVVGGVGQRPQVNGLRRGVDVVIATPGRLLDLINQGHAKLGKASIMVLDEGDRMLDMGFIRDVRKIASHLPTQRQSLLFSATMPGDVARLAGELLNHPVRVEVTPSATAVERIRQQVFFVGASGKRDLLIHVLTDPALSRVIVFARTKRGADRVAKNLAIDGVSAEAIHGNKSQGARQRALKRFKDGQARVLVATDIASRGIDVDDVSHVINYELPNEPESYVHRIGRTARAGADGAAFSFCDSSERAYLRDIEKLTKGRLPVAEGHADNGEPAPARPKSRPGRARNAGHRKGNGSNTNPGRNPGGNARRKNRRPKKRAA
ncbi:MAG: DEAD/DEAH box helicase [Alphaproteobacteria bacterium]